jgi:diaminopimelate epimerase
MKRTFYKYQGTGNDFVMLDNRDKNFPKNNTKLVKNLCDRRFGIGADGLILLENSEVEEDDFKMVYFNADGNESSMCGNGGRCLVAFAKFLEVIDKSAVFTAIDGRHEASIENDYVSLKMQDISEIKIEKDYSFLDTGSPHHVIFTENIERLNVAEKGAVIRYSELYKAQGGSNINFVEKIDNDSFAVRTYERGVEDETLSCGTGVTAVAIAAYQSGLTTSKQLKLNTLGGELEVKFEKGTEGYQSVWLSGPAVQVFKGEISC